MVYVVVTLFAIGSMCAPIGIMIAGWRSRKKGSKFANPEYAAKFKVIMLLISVALVGLSFFVLNKMP